MKESLHFAGLPSRIPAQRNSAGEGISKTSSRSAALRAPSTCGCRCRGASSSGSWSAAAARAGSQEIAKSSLGCSPSSCWVRRAGGGEPGRRTALAPEPGWCRIGSRHPVEGLWSSLKTVELANLTSTSLAEVTARRTGASSACAALRTWPTRSCGTPACRSYEHRR
jgi:hypothetical protein